MRTSGFEGAGIPHGAKSKCKIRGPRKSLAFRAVKNFIATTTTTTTNNNNNNNNNTNETSTHTLIACLPYTWHCANHCVGVTHSILTVTRERQRPVARIFRMRPREGSQPPREWRVSKSQAIRLEHLQCLCGCFEKGESCRFTLIY